MFAGLKNWLWRRRAAREWRVIERWSNDVVCDGLRLGTTWVVGEMNGLGLKRIRIVEKGAWPSDGRGGGAWAMANEWLTRPEPVAASKLRIVK